MLHALGVRFFRSAGVGQSKSGDSSSGREAFNPTGGTLCEIDRVDLPEGWRPRTDRRTTGVAAHTASPAPAALHGVRLVAASDVTNPLLGRHGTATVFAPQKGAGEREVGLLEDGLAHLVRMLDAAGLPASATAGLPGAGAAGGIGFACLLLGAEMRSGAEFFLDLLDFDETARGADLVITGEGRLDEQTAQGKLPAVLAARARAAGARRVIAVVGAMSDGADASGFDEVLTCEDATGRSTAGDADATRAALEEIGARLR